MPAPPPTPEFAMSQAASAHRLIRTKRNKAAIPQLGVSDRPTFLSHTVRAEAAAGADEVIVLVAGNAATISVAYGGIPYASEQRIISV